MKQIATIISAIMIIASCGTNPNRSGSEPLDRPAEEVKAPLCGGYTEQREPTEEDVAMFKAVTAGEAMTLTPLSVATQVVAGLNYKFWCRFEDSARGKSGHCWVTIYKPISGEPQLSGIEEIN